MLYNGMFLSKTAVDAFEKIFAGKSVPARIITPFEPVTGKNIDKYLKMIYGK
jgi:hypothetical protein